MPCQRFIVAGRAMAGGARPPSECSPPRRCTIVRPPADNGDAFGATFSEIALLVASVLTQRGAHSVKAPISLRSVETEQFSYVTMFSLLSKYQSCSIIDHPRIRIGLCFEQDLRDLKMAL